MKRNNYLDGIKFMLIVLVVFGHTIEYSIKTNALLQPVYNFIYLFHMPFFIIISGYVSKNLDINKINRFAIKILETYLIFQLFFILKDYFIFKRIKMANLIVPYWVLWYLISLISWKYVLYFSKKITHNDKIILTVSLVISGIIGFINFNGYPFSVTRTISFFPFFFIGYHLKEKKIEEIIQKKNYFNVFIPIAFLLLCYSSLVKNYNGFTLLLYNSRPYNQTPIHNSIDFITDVIIFFSSLILSYSILTFFPSIKSFEKLGKGTLVFYLYHPVILIFLRKIMFDKMGLQSNSLNLLIQFFITMGILIILNKIKLFHLLLNPLTYIGRYKL